MTNSPNTSAAANTVVANSSSASAASAHSIMQPSIVGNRIIKT